MDELFSEKTSNNHQLMRINITCNTPQLNYQYSGKNTGIIGIYGISGSGKSSLLDTIAGYNQEATGQVTFRQQSLFDSKKRSPINKCNYMRQHPILFSHWNVEKNLQFAQKYSATKKDYKDILKHLGCMHLLNNLPHQLSGGEKQRVVFARSLLQIEHNGLVLLDEPFSALDFKTRHKAWQMLSAHQDHCLIFIATHDIDEIYRYADQFIYIDNGQISYHNDIIQTMSSGFADLPLASRVTIDGHTIIYADDVSISLEKNPHSSIIHQLAVKIAHINILKDTAIISMEHQLNKSVNHNTVLAKITVNSLKKLQLKPQQQVFACFKASSYTIPS